MPNLEKFERGHLFLADTTNNEKIFESRLANAWIAKFNSLPYGMRFYLNDSGEWYHTENPLMAGFNKLHEFDAKCHKNGWTLEQARHLMNDDCPIVIVTWRRTEREYPW